MEVSSADWTTVLQRQKLCLNQMQQSILTEVHSFQAPSIPVQYCSMLSNTVQTFVTAISENVSSWHLTYNVRTFKTHLSVTVKL